MEEEERGEGTGLWLIIHQKAKLYFPPLCTLNIGHKSMSGRSMGRNLVSPLPEGLGQRLASTPSWEQMCQSINPHSGQGWRASPWAQHLPMPSL